MILEKLKIINYKSFESFSIDFNENMNILVGDNEVGKSTILEAINLLLTGKLNGTNLSFCLSPFLFNQKVVAKYIDQLKDGKNPEPPMIKIEGYFRNTGELAKFKGSNNTEKIDTVGLRLEVKYDDDYADVYQEYIENPDEIRTIPLECYEVKFYDFSDRIINHRNLPLKSDLIDTTLQQSRFGTERYVSQIVNNHMDSKEKALLALDFRKLKETFSEQSGVKKINQHLGAKKGEISDKTLSLSVDITPKAGWESSLTSYLEDLPFSYTGMGEQNRVKILLALQDGKSKDSNIILIEEPENHLSYSNLNKLIEKVSQDCEGRQVIITTHDAFVLNKLGLKNVILLSEAKQKMTLSDLDPETQKYFKKLPGYDTLRLVLSKKVILVEGPSDELIIQKAYKDKHDKLPIENGVDVISVRGISFKRFLEIANLLKIDVSVVIDNDGNIDNVNSKFEDYKASDTIKICFSDKEEFKTLEPQLVNTGDNFTILKKVLKKESINTAKELSDYMEKNKTEVALKIFETSEKITMPKYIEDAIK
jgi:predicted ATP-dependent endonuclease of OLD family